MRMIKIINAWKWHAELAGAMTYVTVNTPTLEHKNMTGTLLSLSFFIMMRKISPVSLLV